MRDKRRENVEFRAVDSRCASFVRRTSKSSLHNSRIVDVPLKRRCGGPNSSAVYYVQVVRRY